MEPDYIRLKEIKPVLTEYVRESITMLKKSSVPDENVIHDVRVLMKKARAILKLAGPHIDTDLSDRDIQSFRKVGQIMSSWRDTSVHRKYLKEMRKEFPGLFLKLAANERIGVLIKKPLISVEPDKEMLNKTVEISELLRKAGYRIRFYPMHKIDPVLLLKELEFTYTRVVDKYLICRNYPKPENLHEFRKKSKDFLYQLYFFRPLNPSGIKSVEKKIELMTVYLGRYNDLSLLINSLGYKYPNDSDIPEMDELIIKIKEKQDNYLLKVWPIAYRYFCPGKKLVNLLGYKLLVY